MAKKPENKRWDPAVSAAHPVNNRKSADKLTEFIKRKLDYAKIYHDAQIDRFTNIDKDFNAYFELDKDDLQRFQKRMQGKKLQPTKTVLPFTAAHIEDFVTYAMSIIAPDTGMFEAIAERTKQDVAKGFALDLNRSATVFQYYPEYVQFFTNAMKYDLAWMGVDWEELRGNKVGSTASGQLQVDEDTKIWSGNMLTCYDVYNFLADPAVPPHQLPVRGEFFAIPTIVREFQLRQMEEAGLIHGVDRLFSKEYGHAQFQQEYYKPRPRLQGVHITGGQADANDWISILSMGTSQEAKLGIELVTIHIWVKPKDFNLSLSEKMEIWRIRMANSKEIMSAERMNNAHGLLPVVAAKPNYSNLEHQAQSYTEMLIPLQVFGNFLLNLHIQASRKKLYGVVVYKQNILPLDSLGDEVVGYIPCDTSGLQEDLRTAFVSITDAPETGSTMGDLANVLDLMQKLLPTDILRQITDLQRATQYQAAETKAAGHRKQYKILRVIDAQAFGLLRIMLMYNTFQFREAIEIIDSEGNTVKLNPDEYRNSNLEFAVSDGLKGIDRMSLIETMKEIVTVIIQSQQAIQEIDVVALFSYMTSLAGDKTDLAQFKKKIPSLIEFVGMIEAQDPEMAKTLAPLVQQIYQSATAEKPSNGGQGAQDTIPSATPPGAGGPV
jgi:hypothetical protein